MRIIRYVDESSVPVLAALTDQEEIYRLPYPDFIQLIKEAAGLKVTPRQLIGDSIAGTDPLKRRLEDLRLLVPIIAPEVWASGVTYEKSRDARNYETTGGRTKEETYYDRVYDAERPEIFFKSTAARTIGPDDPVYLRSDSQWQIPEPELGLVLDSAGNILGYTIGNDMSCRDIEGENPLYLPQAKVWKHSCSIGPAIRLTETVEDAYDFQLTCRIYRNGRLAVEGSANTAQLKRKYEELILFLKRDNELFDGTVLLTGTSIVPPNDFTLQENDQIEIEISTIGVLKNPVKMQKQAGNLI